MTKNFSIKEAFSIGWKVVTSHFWLIVGMMLTINLVQSLFNMIVIIMGESSLRERWFLIYPNMAWVQSFTAVPIYRQISLKMIVASLGVTIMSCLVFTLFFIGFTKVLFKCYDNQPVNYSDFIQESFKWRTFFNYLGWMGMMLIPFFLISMLGMGVAMLFGMNSLVPQVAAIAMWKKISLLILFGISLFYMIRYLLHIQFTGLFIIDRGVGFIQAMKQSSMAVVGIIGKVLLFDAIWMCIFTLGMLTVIGNLFITPLCMVALISIYRSLLRA